MKKILVRGSLVLLVLLVVFTAYAYIQMKPLDVNQHDARILARTMELLDQEQKWFRNDNRKCSEGSDTISLYCALKQASLEVSGNFEHKAASLHQVRKAIVHYKEGVKYSHPIMDFNNDRAIALSDIQSVLAASLNAINEECKSKVNDGNPCNI